ncbi:LPS export ABC transporter permease LptF [Rhodoferax koreense]|uniref:Lipopolysaccharide export system permease protein LptF n=1 Tax=Rhodoferax koreensis TaxID=1842727 RepID=A0A1P8JWJ7_9BURK|nr:LPS export ABC transporter permease LptF [Rhodoferax koreense]APW38132.1 LPS export ABC transporter permease LptF [Rhodoferax koreense]
MLFHSSIRKELARSFGATLVALITIVMTMMLIRTLGQASRGSVNPSDVMLVMGYTVLGYLPTILTLSLFVAVVACLSRMYRDSEMVIWFGAGRGLAFLLTPLLRFAWPVLLVVAVSSLFVWPWTNQRIQDMKDRYEQRGDLERITPGQFQESASGNRVFFIDKDSPDNRTGNNVFISAVDHGKEAVTSARSARVESVGDGRFLMLSNGQRLESNIGQAELKVSEFKEYGTRIDAKTLSPSDNVPPRALASIDLLRQPTALNMGELGWRVGLAFASLNFVVLGLALASGNPRSTRGGGLMFALFAFVVYFNLLNLGQSWVGSGKLPFAAFIAGLHGGIFLLAVGWLMVRHHHWSWRSLLAGPRRASAASGRTGAAA